LAWWPPISAGVVGLVAVGWLAGDRGGGNSTDVVRSSVSQYLAANEHMALATFGVDNILFSPSNAAYAHFIVMTSGPSGGDVFSGFAHRGGGRWSVVRLGTYACAADAPPVPTLVLSEFGENCISASEQTTGLTGPSPSLSSRNHSPNAGDSGRKPNSVAQELQVRVERRSAPRHRPSGDPKATDGAPSTGLLGLGQP
jgi:hypothetical protein